MKSLEIFFVISVLCVSVGKAQNVNVNCQFVRQGSDYICELFGVELFGVLENENFIIGGEHHPARGNLDVTRILISNSNIPFIIPQLFTTFPNAVHFVINNGGLMKVQSNAFANAASLKQLFIIENPQLRSIEANALSGAKEVWECDLGANSIETIHETAFEGMISVRNLLLDQNLIRQLPANVFSTLMSLQVVILSENQLTSLDGRLFENNPQISSINFASNKINAIGRNFLNFSTQLLFVDAFRNVCANNYWRIGGTTTIETIRAGLSRCFDNFVEPQPEPEPENELRRFVLELRGPLSLRFQNGTEIVRV